MLDYDWQESLTAEKIEQEFSLENKPFKFRGPGWYMDDDVLLIVPDRHHNGFYDCYVWNTPDFDPRDRLYAISLLPNRTIAENWPIRPKGK